VSISPKEACAGTMDGAYTSREGERVNGASSRSLKRSGKRLSYLHRKVLIRKRHGGTRSRSKLGVRLTRTEVERPLVSGK